MIEQSLTIPAVTPGNHEEKKLEKEKKRTPYHFVECLTS
jgi:hypothetical protein